VSYRPRAHGSTPLPSGRTVDGQATYIVAFVPASMAVGTQRSSSVTSAAPDAVVHLWGGALRSNGTFLPIQHRGTVQTANWEWVSTLDFTGGLYRVRSTVSSSLTGAGNTLSAGVIVCEFIP
jgi:hypothetical protein